MSRFARGGVIRRGPQGDDIPALLTSGCEYLVRQDSAFADELAEAWRKAQTRPVRLLTPLPRRTRVRLAVRRAVNEAGIWLAGHGHHGAALWLWRDRRRGQ